MRANSILKKVPLHRLDPATWPNIDIEALEPSDRDFARKLRPALTDLLKGASASAIQAAHDVAPDHLREILNRCLTPHPEDGDIYGFRALVRWQRQASYQRVAPVVRDAYSGRGHCAGALTQLLSQHPEVAERLFALIQNKDKVSEPRPRLASVHAEFIRICRDLGRESNHLWPFNTKTLGRTSIRLLMAAAAEKDPIRSIGILHGANARVRTQTGRGYTRLLNPPGPSSVIGIDELSFDGITTIALPVPGGGEQDIPIQRVSIVLVVDVHTRRILGWHAYFSPSVSAADMRRAIQNAINPVARCDLTLPLAYPTPSQAIPDPTFECLAYTGWTTVWLDSALGHQDLRLVADINRVLGSSVNFGPVGQWYRRAVLERRIKEVLFQCAHRLPSTTGSHPTDPLKSNPAEQAVRLRIRWAEIRQLVDVVIADQNVTPCEAIGHLAPDALQQQWIADSARGFLLRPLPRSRHDKTSFVRVFEVKPVGGSRRDGRRPFITIDRVRYTSQQLANNWTLIGKELRVGIDEGDMRQVTVSLMGSGQQLEPLAACGGWALLPHTRQMRKEINRLFYLKIIHCTNHDPVRSYLTYLQETARKQVGTAAKRTRVSRAATRLAASEEGAGIQISDVLTQMPPPEPKDFSSGIGRSGTRLRDLLGGAK